MSAIATMGLVPKASIETTAPLCPFRSPKRAGNAGMAAKLVGFVRHRLPRVPDGWWWRSRIADDARPLRRRGHDCGARPCRRWRQNLLAAGHRTLRASAHREAGSHLTKAIELLEGLPEGAVRKQ